MTAGPYRAHKITRTTRPDGAVIVTTDWPLGPVADRTTDWLHLWAAQTPDAVFLAERSGAGWRTVTYAQALDHVRALAAGLLDRGLTPAAPLLVISGNSVNHGLLALAAQYIGVPVVPVAEQYGLIPAAHGQLAHVAAVTRPGMVYADSPRFADALNLPCFDGVQQLTDATLPELMRALGDVEGVHAGIGPDTVAKILMTSGSTSQPKGVVTTHRMMCTNQAQLQVALPFLTRQPPRIVDWLPWNHVFGGSHNFNMMLANGGALYIDDGKPTPALAARTLENLGLVTGTIAFNVPIGFQQVRDAMKADAGLRQRYFQDLDMLFYAGASLPQDVWADLLEMAQTVRGELPLFTSSWGLTETAPCCLIQHEQTTQSGVIGVPVAGVTLKLLPDAQGRAEVRVKGPSITPGYHNAPDKTAEAFDDEGYLLTGDAVCWIDPDTPALGLRFDGRIAEEFKLLSGTWVRAAGLRLACLGALRGLAADIVLTGADRADIGVMIVPSGALRDGATDDNGALHSPLAGQVATVLAAANGTSSSTRITRALILTEPPSIALGEVTAKGNLNFRKIQMQRAALVDRLYDDADPSVIHIPRAP